ncbi:hypothetical protein ACFWVM_01180 [Nocardia fluminea]|uniref:hypothetical protein n=1 Tax=Nocardia fluminea TaxID=134984 RepID=UPI0036603ECA
MPSLHLTAARAARDLGRVAESFALAECARAFTLSVVLAEDTTQWWAWQQAAA